MPLWYPFPAASGAAILDHTNRLRRERIVTETPGANARILAYLAMSHRAHEMAETSIIELERELDLPRDVVRHCLEDLVARGLASGDLFPLIAWVRITPEGAAAIESRPNGASPE